MATITVKNIPDDLYQKLKNTASSNHRSVNNEVINCIENMVRSRKINPYDFVNQIDRFYENIEAPFLTDEKLEEYKEAGRS
jgi:antitoxin FitA